MSTRATKLSSLYHAAVGRPPAERVAFVRSACDDEALREELESLLALDGAAAGFLEPVDLVGQAWGPYTIRGRLGAGGMGEVYRAHDAKLGRDVALKVLRSGLGGDPERRARLTREARVLATLSHPHIGAIYGLEERDGAVALVLELVEGATLAERLARGALPVRDALLVARQLAGALEAAHDSGLVHRDLKPANIALQQSADGTPHAKILDFGLAKPLAQDGGSRTSVGDTTEGRILGTPAYMSPEQARGLAVDRRTDIWAFGCVLFEMLSGVLPFAGTTIPDTLARILDHEPDWSALPRNTPASVVRLLEHCLRKDARRRLHDIGDALIELDDLTRLPIGRRMLSAVRSWPGVVLLLAGAAGILAAGVFLIRPGPAATESVSFTVPPPPGSDYSGTAPAFAISPDGRHLAWAAQSNGVSRVWVRALSSLDARPLSGTDGAWGPFWRPDSRTLGFFASGMLKTVALDGGSPLTLGRGDFGAFAGGAWNDRDDIVFTSSCCLWHVKAVHAAPPPRQLTTTKGEEVGHYWPSFLSDRDHFIYFVQGETTNEVRVGSLSSSETRSLGVFESHLTYLDGRVFYIRNGNLMTQAFDTASFRLQGEPRRLDVEAAIDPPWQRGIFSVVPTALAYRSVARAPTVLAWVNRNGKVLDTVGEPAPIANVGLSVDGSRIAVSRLTEQAGVPAQHDIWTLDQTGGSPLRLPYDNGWEWDPTWAPDGRQIAFTSDRGHRFRQSLYVEPANGMGEAVMLDEAANSGADWSPDGRHIIYNRVGPRYLDLWTIDMAGDRKPRPFLQTAFREAAAVFSPDSRWVAYFSNITGRDEVYLRRFPAGQDAIRVSTNSGTQPRWRSDGRELFFVAQDGALMAVDVDLARSTVGQPHALFQSLVRQRCCNSYAVAPGGERFLMVRQAGEPPPITVVLNWQARLHR